MSTTTRTMSLLRTVAVITIQSIGIMFALATALGVLAAYLGV